MDVHFPEILLCYGSPLKRCISFLKMQIKKLILTQNFHNLRSGHQDHRGHAFKMKQKKMINFIS